MRHTDRICKLIKYKKRLKKRIGKLTRSIYYFPTLLYCLPGHKPSPIPFDMSKRSLKCGDLYLWSKQGSPCPGLGLPQTLSGAQRGRVRMLHPLWSPYFLASPGLSHQSAPEMRRVLSACRSPGGPAGGVRECGRRGLCVRLLHFFSSEKLHLCGHSVSGGWKGESLKSV